jgi:predicted PurR-regulated permease PerM
MPSLLPPPRGPEEVTALETLWQNPWVRGVTYVVALAALLTFLVSQRSAFTTAMVVGLSGFLIAYILNPLVVLVMRIRIGRLGVARGPAVVIVFIFVLQLLIAGSVLFGQVVNEAARFVSLLPVALENLGRTFGDLTGWVGSLGEVLPAFLQERLGIEAGGEDFSLQVQEQLSAWIITAAQGLVGFLERLVSDGPGFLVAGATTIVSGAFQAVLIAIASVYILYDLPRLSANVRRFVPVRYRGIYADLMQKADRAVGGFLRGQVLISLTIGTLLWIGLSILGLPLATAISVLAGVFNLVPYLGPIVATIPAVLLGFTVSPVTALLALIVFFVANQLEAHLFGPMILGKSTDLHPVTVLVSILIGVGFLGVLGAFLAVPVVAMAKVVLEEYLLTRPPYQEDPAAAEGVLPATEPPVG